MNCTNVGLYPDENKPDITYEDIRKNMTVCDVVFNPPETKFLKEAKARGAATVNGLGMLVNQAALNYCLWTENMAPKDKHFYESLIWKMKLYRKRKLYRKI